MSDPITKISYISDGTTTEYEVPFVYLKRDFVKVYINGYATILFTWITPTKIKLRRSPDAKSTILIQRETQLEPLVVFKDATNLTASDLNLMTNQALHLLQEGHEHIATLENLGLANNEQFVLPPLDALSVLGILQGRISALELESGLNDRIDLIDASDYNLIDRMSIAEDSIDSLVTQIGSLAYSPYNAETTYALNDVISFEGKLYKSLQNNNLGNAPDALESTYWTKISDAADLGAAINYEAATRLSDVGALAYQDAKLQATFNQLGEAALNNLDSLNKIDAKSAARYAASVDALATETEARVQAIESLQSTFDTEIATTNAAITNLQITVANGDSANATALESLKSTFDNKITDTNATITNLQTTVANGDSANATAITQLSSTVDNNTIAIETVASTTDSISAKYTVKIDASGYVVGYGLIANAAKDNNPPDSAFIIKADKFAFGYPGYQGSYPFMIGVVDGISRVGINGELLVDGTIGANKIRTNELVVGNNISMGPNAYISWSNITTKPTIPSNTNQLTDGAGLGTTATWTSVAGRPNTTYIDSNGIYTGTLTANQVDVWNSIQSAYPAYIAGVQGWKIDKYGQSEFQNIKARGDIEATSLKANTAMIDSANIKDLAVNTLKIANNSVSISAYASGTSLGILIPEGLSGNVLISCIINCSGYASAYPHTLSSYINGSLQKSTNISICTMESYIYEPYSEAPTTLWRGLLGSASLSYTSYLSSGYYTISIGSTATISSSTISVTMLLK